MSGRVLVVDDSAFVRKVLREILTRGGLEVIDIARDGLEALEKIDRLAPDVVTLDLMMPHLDGLGVLRELAARSTRPSVVAVSVAGHDTALGVAALSAGALAVVEKPTSLASTRLYELDGPLLSAVREALAARPAPVCAEPPPLAPRVVQARRTDLVVIGASTGGPQAVSRILAELPGGLPVPVAIVLHLPVGYTEGYARRVNELSELEVLEARDGLELTAGMAVIARGGLHLRMARAAGELIARLELEPASSLHRPSDDALFESAADARGERVLGVVLTGMGDDGLVGARRIRERGGRVISQAEDGCVIWGMPRAVHLAGLADALVPLPEMTAALLAYL